MVEIAILILISYNSVDTQFELLVLLRIEFLEE